MLDGATRMRTLRDVVLPLAAPGVASTAILTFLYCWNEFLFALSFTLGPERYTVPVAIMLFRGRYQVPWGEVLAAAVVATIPVALLVLACQRRIVAGLTARRHERVSVAAITLDRDLKDLSKRPRRDPPSRPAHRGRRVPGAGRAIGLRQEHAAQADCRPRNAHGRPHSHRRRGHDRPTAAAARPRDGFSELCAVPAHERARQPCLRVAGAADGRRHDCAAGREWSPQALDIEDVLDRRPAQLSGGQRQRVALGRAIVRKANAFLLDEPLSNLDPALRAQARAELRRLHRQLGTTVVYVTHDQEEAMTLSGRIAVMRDGALEQVAPPLEVYARPANTFVARFIGAPAMNLLPAAVAGIEAPDGAVAGIRPQDVRVGTEGRRRATVELVEPRGPDYVLHLHLDGSNTPLLAVVSGPAAPAAGADVFVTLPADRLHIFDQRNGSRLTGA